MLETPQSGYDLPVYGIGNGTFLQIHVTAISCIFCSIISGLGVIFVSYKEQSQISSSFFERRPIQRFFVYLAVCDVLFGSCHCLDHLHILITHDHVHPKGLCVFYAVMVNEFVVGQNLMVNVVAVNTFMMIYFEHRIDLGRYDWKVLLWIFGIPFIISLAAAGFDVFGPTGGL